MRLGPLRADIPSSSSTRERELYSHPDINENSLIRPVDSDFRTRSIDNLFLSSQPHGDTQAACLPGRSGMMQSDTQPYLRVEINGVYWVRDCNQ